MMNWGTIVRFRKQVEDMIKEELALAEWEKSQEISKQEILQADLETISLELERNLPHGIAGSFTEERYRWLEETSQRLERQALVLGVQEKKIAELQDKLKDAYHSRRIIEMIMTKKHADRQQRIMKHEQKEQDDLAGLRVLASREGS
jgi:flagellar export protein FliJ